MESGNDPRLRRLLHEWQVADAPAALEQRVLGQPSPWWRRLLRSRVRIPLPIAIVFSIALVWLTVIVVTDGEPTSIPLGTTPDLRGFQPVSSVSVRIERNGDATK